MERIKYSLVLKNKTRKNPKWYIRVRQEGFRERLVPTETSSRQQAELRLRAAQRAYDEACDLERMGLPVPAAVASRVLRAGTSGAVVGITVRKATEKWESWLRLANYSEGTIRNYTEGVLRVLDGGLPVDSLDRDTVLSGFARKASLSSATRRSLSNYVRAFLGWLAEDTGRDLKEALKAVPRVKAVYAHKVAWTDNEVRRILSCVHHARPEVEAQLKLFFTLLATTGCRDGELRALRWEQFGPDRVTFLAENTKSRKERTVPINRTVQELAAPLREATGEVFNLVPRTNSGRNLELRSAMYRAEVKAGSMHSFRTSLATRWARTGVPVKATQQLLGHSSPSTTLEYYTAQDSMDTLAKFVEDGDVTKW